jgi:tetratricopeptide (TPR) repeat protein
LYKLNYKDTDLGTKFAGDMIDKLRGGNLATDLYSARIAVELLSFSRSPTEFPGQKMPSPRTRPLKLAQEQRRELVEMITNAALEGSADTNLLFAMNQVMPEIEQFAPERVALLRKKRAAFSQTLNKEQRLSEEFNSVVRNGTPEDLLRLANRSGEDLEWLQQQAIVLAVMRRRADSLREFINTEIEDQSRRKSLLDALDAEQIDVAAYKGDVEELQKLLPQIRRKEERARAMTQIAMLLEKRDKHDEALKLLDEAQTLIKTNLNSETQTNALLALVGAYALVEPAKAFGILERTIDRANDEVTKALLLDKIARSGVVKKGEIRLSQSGMIPFDLAVFKYGKSVAALANADFDRTKAAADRFERNELRLIVRLLLAQALLSKDDQDQKRE